MRTYFILDDVRTVDQSLANAGLAAREDAIYVLVRPFMFNMATGELEYSLADAKATIEKNPMFDVWVLDNDLGPNVEGFSFLKEMCETQPDKVANVCRSCSANPIRREDIEAYHKQFIEHVRLG